MWELLQGAVSSKSLAFKTILMDPWYTSQKVMQAIDKLGKIYFSLKKNRLIDNSEGKEDYKFIESLSRTRLRTKVIKTY